MGSARPHDLTHLRLPDHVADAVAVLDAAGTDRVVVIGWSVGATVATELARRYPDRVTGLLLISGAAGDLFGGTLGLLGLPLAAGRTMAAGVARVAAAAGPLLNSVLHRVPVNALTANLMRHSGLMLPGSPTRDVIRAARRFLRHDWGWYGRLAAEMAAEPTRSPVDLRCPITLLMGRYDVLVDARHAAQALGSLPQARIRILPTSHFIPFEAPDVVLEELLTLLTRADAVRTAMRRVVPGRRDDPPLTERSRPSA